MVFLCGPPHREEIHQNMTNVAANWTSLFFLSVFYFCSFNVLMSGFHDLLREVPFPSYLSHKRKVQKVQNL
jgi:hypothetical protein